MNYYLYFALCIIVVLLILGISYAPTYTNENVISKKLNLDELLGKPKSSNVLEGFNSREISSQNEIENGASNFYGWAGMVDEEEEKPKHKHKHKHCDKKNDKDCIKQTQNYTENDIYVYPTARIYEEPSKCKSCEKCDINKHPDINMYVLKSSVPACPDMSNYALKSMVKSCPDMKDYIKKSKIPPTKKCPNMNDYVLKSSIPATPQCPVCPVCPVCPKTYKNIEDDPRFNSWFRTFRQRERKSINKNFIRRNQCKRQQDKIREQARKEGKEEAYREIARDYVNNDPRNIRRGKKANVNVNANASINIKENIKNIFKNGKKVIKKNENSKKSHENKKKSNENKNKMHENYQTNEYPLGNNGASSLYKNYNC